MKNSTQKEKTENKQKHPKEKLLCLGSHALSGKELLSVLLGSGISESTFKELSKLINNDPKHISVDELLKIKGISREKAARISAAFSFTKQFYISDKESEESGYIAEETQEYLTGFLKNPQQGKFGSNSCSDSKDFANMVNQVHAGDCLEVMRRIPSGTIDMILCDLPYGTTQNKWDSVIPLNRLWCEYERILKRKGVVVLTAQGVFTAKVILSNEAIFKYKIVWEKSKPTNFLNAKKQPLRKHEDLCVFYREQPIYNPQMTKGSAYNKGVRKNQLTGSYGDFKPVEVKSSGERYPLDLLYFKTAESEGPVYHPTQKPVELGRYLIRTFTNPGAVVLDNACGSGSFLVSAVLEGRQFIGIEKNTDVHLFKKKTVDYIQICNERIKQARLTKSGDAVAI
jgi:site-specific DNA-methyltransferase (adenine-specific)/modification methylase